MTELPPHLRLPRGIFDLGPAEALHVRAVEEAWVSHAQTWGHRPVRVPPVGMAETFEFGHHAAGERTYQFLDRSQRSLALVPDSLPAIAALVARRPEPALRVSFSCPVFRYRHARRRHWHHLGALAVVPAPRPTAEADAFMVERLLSLVLSFVAPRLPVRVVVTDIGLWRLLLRDDGVAANEVASALHGLARLPDEARPQQLAVGGLTTPLVRLAEHAARAPSFAPTAAAAAELVEALNGEAAERAARLIRLATRIHTRHAVEVDIRPGDFHAAEFHDGLAFQILGAGDGRRLSDGGSYSEFACQFFAREVALYSTVVGLEEVARRTGPAPPDAAAVMLWSGPERAAHDLAADVADALRAAGIAVHEEPVTGDIGKVLRTCESLRIPHFIRVGAAELQTGVFRVRERGGAMTELPQAKLVAWLRARLAR